MLMYLIVMNVKDPTVHSFRSMYLLLHKIFDHPHSLVYYIVLCIFGASF